MDIGEGIALGSFGLGVIVFLWRTSIVHDRKIGRVYGRLDEVKDKHHKEFVSKEACGLIQNPMKEDIKEIKRDVKSLLQKNGIK